MDLPFLIKYQPQKINDFMFDTSLKNFINSLLNTNIFNILVLGRTGSGKTSLIKAIINEYFKNHENMSENILYINSLREQGISYYRNEVKTFCQTTCTIHNKKKIVVLDDIDIITDQSQQVFRNCIDKYCNNVNFISTCTNIQKILESIQSRLLVIKITSLTRDNLYNIMNHIIGNENITITEEGKQTTLNICDNSIRLLINYLEKFKLLEKPINSTIANDVCTNISFDKFKRLTNTAIIKKDLHASIKQIYDIYNNGYSVMDILDNYFQYIKFSDILDEDQKYKIIKLICKYITIINDIHEHHLELTFFINNLIKI